MKIIRDKALLLKVRNPKQITTVIPKSKEVSMNEVVVNSSSFYVRQALKKLKENTLNKNPGSLVSQNLTVQMDSTQVLCKKDAFVLNFEFKQYRARVNHVARERSLNLSFGRSQGPERGRNAETVTAKERFVL